MIKGLVISDIHFDALNSKKLYDELNKYFLNKIRKYEKNELDLVVLAGDFYDHKVSLNSEASKFSIEFLNKLVNLARIKNFSIRILKGTKNHDLDQLNNFLYLQEKKSIDLRIINTVTSETFKDVDILYLPEQYMEDKKEFYKNFFNKKYDLCFFHGTFKHVEFVSNLVTSERPISDAPIFSIKEFQNMIKGPVIGGHIHIASNYKNKIFYTGSFSRWKFGEEKNKGFRTFEYDEATGEYVVKFVTNKDADLYITKNIENLVDVNDIENLNKQIEKIKTFKKERNIKNLRIVIGDQSIDPSNLDIMKQYFSENEDNNIKLSLNKKVHRQKNDNDELEKKYSFLFNNKYDMDKIISKYLETHDNITLNEEIIKEIISSDD